MKKINLRCCYIFATCLASLTSTPALANDGGIEVFSDGAKAGTVVPIEITDIRLVEEHVTITRNNSSINGYSYANDKAEVYTKLIFWNGSNKAKKQLIGFPVDDTYSIKVDEFSAIPDPSNQQIDKKNIKWDYSLKTKVNGKQFDVSKVIPGKSLTSKNAQKTWNYFVFDITFPPNQKTIIEHKYEILPNIDIAETPEESTNDLIYGYISSTGQFWQGKPDKAVFEFRNKSSSYNVVDYSGPGEAKKEVFFRDGYTVYRATYLKPQLSKDVEFRLTSRGMIGAKCESFYDYADLSPVLNQLLDKEGSWSFNLELSLANNDIKNLSWRDRILVSELADAKGVNHVCRKGVRRDKPDLSHKCVLIDGPANMRLFPGGPVIASINDGAFVHIYEQRGDWYGLVAAKKSHCQIPEYPPGFWRGRYDAPLYLGFTYKNNIKYNLNPTTITSLILRTHLDEPFRTIKTLKREDKFFISNKMFDGYFGLGLGRTDAELNHPHKSGGSYIHINLKSGQWLTESEAQEKVKSIVREASENLKGKLSSKLNAKLANVIDKSDCATVNGLPSVFVFGLADVYIDFDIETAKIGCWPKDLLPVYMKAISQDEQIKTIRKWNQNFLIETKVSRGPDGILSFDHELKLNSHYQWGATVIPPKE